MKILLVGEFSNVHNTLANGLRALGHQVTLVSDGDGWKDYSRDIDLKRNSKEFFYSLSYLMKVKCAFRKLKGYDVVQLINPVFLPLKAERMYSLYDFLKKHNRNIYLGAFGLDYYWVKAGVEAKTFRYSDFNIGDKLRHSADIERWKADWLYGEKGKLTRFIANDCDGIIAGLYEYYASYKPFFYNKLAFIPFPIDIEKSGFKERGHDNKVNFFIGIQKNRSEYKGTDIMLNALERVKSMRPEDCNIKIVESVPFNLYRNLMNDSDVILDQLYSYTPAMNALEAMAQGLIVVGGGEPENYEILGETKLKPIINVLPSEESVFGALCRIVDNRKELPQLSVDSREYIVKHHDIIKVAKHYLNFWREHQSY